MKKLILILSLMSTPAYANSDWVAPFMGGVFMGQALNQPRIYVAPQPQYYYQPQPLYVPIPEYGCGYECQKQYYYRQEHRHHRHHHDDD